MSFRTRADQPTIKIIKNAVIGRPQEQPHEMVMMRENMASEQLDIGTHVLRKNNIEVVTREEEEEKNQEDDFDRLGLLVERHSVIDDLVEDEVKLRSVAKEVFVTLDDNIENFVGVTKRAQSKIRE